MGEAEEFSCRVGEQRCVVEGGGSVLLKRFSSQSDNPMYISLSPILSTTKKVFPLKMMGGGR